jgi:BlaI family transcriptional regulator, penicillinase repressor
LTHTGIGVNLCAACLFLRIYMGLRPAKPEREHNLSRRERQIMDVLFALSRASGQQIRERLPDSPSYSGVRTILRVLERKGLVRHVEEGLRYVYLPAVPREAAKRSAIERLLRTFFDGSTKAAMAAFLDSSSAKLSKSELDEIKALIRKAKKEARE